MATYFTSAERRKMNDAIRAYDRALALRAMCERLARLTIITCWLFILIALFYVGTN